MLKQSTKTRIKNTVNLFSKYCEEEGSSLEEAIGEIKICNICPKHCIIIYKIWIVYNLISKRYVK